MIVTKIGVARTRSKNEVVEWILRSFGDVANFSHQGGKPLPGIAPFAMQTGEQAARNILARALGSPTKTFKYWDKGSMATIGRNKAIADLKVLRLSGFLAWLSWLLIHLLFIVELRNRILIFFQIKTEARYDGLWVLRTNTVYNAETVAHVYKRRSGRSRTSSALPNRLWTPEPIYRRCNETIRGHVFCGFRAAATKNRTGAAHEVR